MGHQPRGDIAHIPIGILSDIPQQPRVQLLLVQRGLQVDIQPVRLPLPAPQMGAGGQHQRPRHAEMGEQQLAELPEHRLFLPVVHRQLHVPQAQPLHVRAVAPGAHQRHQRAAGRHHRVPQLLRHAIAVPGGAGARIGHTAGGQYHRLRGIGILLPLHGRHRAVLRLYMQRPIPHPADAAALQLPFQCVGDVKGAVGHREDPIAPLHLQRHAQLPEKGHGILRREPRQRAVQEPPVAGNVGQ